MSKVLIVDDHPLIRLAIRMMLEGAGHHVVAECESGTACIQAVRKFEPELVILDLGIPELDGLSVISRMKTAGSPSRILVLTGAEPQSYAMRCFQAGASGFVRKDDDLDELLNAIRAVLDGYMYFPAEVLPALQENPQATLRDESQLISALTNREIIVLRLLVQGLTNRDIARLLIVSHKTISTHKMRLMQKLNAANLVDLVRMASRNGIA